MRRSRAGPHGSDRFARDAPVEDADRHRGVGDDADHDADHRQRIALRGFEAPQPEAHLIDDRE